MVSAYLIDALGDPTSELKDLYASYSSSTNFPRDVSRHFSTVFASEEAFREIPLLDASHPPSTYRERSLVRFRAMVQDTSLSSEMYLQKTHSGCMGGWGVYDELDDGGQDIEYGDLRECSVLWAVSVPGESAWCAKELDGASERLASYRSTFSHKYPFPDEPHIAAQVKIYDAAIAENLKSIDLATFVGILTNETITNEGDSLMETPTLHVLFARSHEHKLIPRPYPLKSREDQNVSYEPLQIRERLISWIANQSLGGDKEAAEWVLLAVIARVQSRNPPLLPPAVTICNFPSPESTSSLIPTLSHVLSYLLPMMSTLPLSLDVLNKSSFAPESKQEDLHSGVLQLPHGSTLLITEGGIQEGKLLEKGLSNLNALQEVIASQSLAYQFPFSRFAFPTDINCVVLCEGKKSAFFKTDMSVPLRSETVTDNPSILYKPAGDIVMPPDQDLAVFRDLLVGSQNGNVKVSESVSEHIQTDFVNERQRDPTITADDLIRRMTVAKLCALSLHQLELTVQVWDHAKALDEQRKSRCA